MSNYCLKNRSKLVTIFDNFEQREEKILEKKPRVVEVPRVREARVREGVLYCIWPWRVAPASNKLLSQLNAASDRRLQLIC